jgi:pyruvate dehydrogenase E1 component beta subunit
VLFRSDSVPPGHYSIPIGQSRVLHEGGDVTVAAFSYMAFEALIAAKALAEVCGVHLDVIDMRSVRPLDTESVLASVRRTGRLIVADTAFRTGSVAGELLAQVVEQAFDAMKAAPVRIASPDHPVPTSPFMASAYYPGPQVIADAALRLVERGTDEPDYRDLRAALARNGPHDAPNREFSGPF